MARGISTCALGSLSVLALAGAAQASTITTYSTRASFLAATSGGVGLGFENFEGVTTIGGTYFGYGAAHAFNGGGSTMTASSPSSTLVVIDPFLGGVFHNTSKAMFSNNSTGLDFAFSPGVNAFAADVLSERFGHAMNILVNDEQGNPHTYTTNAGSFPGFFGFTVSGGTVLGISMSNDESEGVDNVYWGFQTIPLPSAAMLAMTGMGGLVVTRRRRFTV